MYILSMKYNEWELKMNQDKTYIWQWYNIILNQFVSFYQFHLQNSTLLADIELIRIFFIKETMIVISSAIFTRLMMRKIPSFFYLGTSPILLISYVISEVCANYFFRETTMENNQFLKEIMDIFFIFIQTL